MLRRLATYLCAVCLLAVILESGSLAVEAVAKPNPPPYGTPLRVPSSDPLYPSIVSERLPTVSYGEMLPGA